MKKILYLIALIFSFTLKAENYFVDGTSWLTMVEGTHEPGGVISYRLEKIEWSEADGCFNLLQAHSSSINDLSDFQQTAYLKTSEGRVYIKSYTKESSEWYLLYDFNLAPGEGCFVYLAGVNHFVSTYVKCVGITESDGWTIMEMEEYNDESQSVYEGKGLWIKGLSSYNGLLFNGYFEAAGGGGKLMEVRANGTLVWSRDTFHAASISGESSSEVRVDGKVIIVTANEGTSVTLYSLSGTRLGEYQCGASPLSITAPAPGAYIIKVGTRTEKVMIP